MRAMPFSSRPAAAEIQPYIIVEQVAELRAGAEGHTAALQEIPLHVGQIKTGAVEPGKEGAFGLCIAMAGIRIASVEGWHARVKAAGAAGLSEILHGAYCDHFFFENPAGYAIEIQRFRNPDVARLFQ